jgi:hypothetical protein
MKTDTEKTDVIFRKEKNGDILAVFPYEPYNDIIGLVGCYAHVGQHSGCQYDYVRQETKPAQPNEYNDLLNELKGIGYNVNIVKKWSWDKYLRRYREMIAVHYQLIAS